jgi:hypothetical protein
MERPLKWNRVKRTIPGLSHRGSEHGRGNEWKRGAAAYIIEGLLKIRLNRTTAQPKNLAMIKWISFINSAPYRDH